MSPPPHSASNLGCAQPTTLQCPTQITSLHPEKWNFTLSRSHLVLSSIHNLGHVFVFLICQYSPMWLLIFVVMMKVLIHSAYCVPSIGLNTLHVLIHLTLTTNPEIVTPCIPILQMRKLKYRLSNLSKVTLLISDRNRKMNLRNILNKCKMPLFILHLFFSYNNYLKGKILFLNCH